LIVQRSQKVAGSFRPVPVWKINRWGPVPLHQECPVGNCQYEFRPFRISFLYNKRSSNEMKALSLFVPTLLSTVLILVPHLLLSPPGGAQDASTPLAASSRTALTPDSAAAKAAERKKRFDEAKKKLEDSDPRPQEQSKNSPSNSS
jgi:hypothetical protein